MKKLSLVLLAGLALSVAACTDNHSHPYHSGAYQAAGRTAGDEELEIVRTVRPATTKKADPVFRAKQHK